MRTLPQVLTELYKCGASPTLTTEGRLKVSFGNAQIPASLMADLKHHADDLKQLLPTLQPRSSSTVIDETVDSVRYTKWTPFDVTLKSTIGWDTETVRIDQANPWETPELILIIATDGDTGYFIDPRDARAFFESHQECQFIAHNAAFDISVVTNHINQPINDGFIWDMVDDGKFICTQEFDRLLSLAFAGISPVRPPSLAVLAEKYLGQRLDKDISNIDGESVRMSFGNFQGQSISVLPEAFLRYAAADAKAPIRIHRKQMALEAKILRDVVPQAFGKLSPEMMAEARAKHGPLGIKIWVISSIICRELSRRGIDIDQDRCQQLHKQFDNGLTEAIAEIRAAGIDMPEPGQKRPKGMAALSTAIRKRLTDLEPELLSAGKISEPFERTASGLLCVDNKRQQEWIELEIDPVISAYSKHEKILKQKSFVENIVSKTIHPRWLCGKASGRFGCSDPNVQQWPKCGKKGKVDGLTIRQMTTVDSGHLLVATDFAQLEMAALGAVHHVQMGLGQSLWDLINEGVDLYVAVFKQLHGREPTPIERTWMKPPVLGYPAGMGAQGIVNDAKKNWGLDLDLDSVNATLAAYEALVPEMKPYRKSTLNVARACSSFLDLKNTNKAWKMLQMLAGDSADLSDEEVAENWELAQTFQSIIETKSAASLKAMKKSLAEKRPTKSLAMTVRNSLTPQPLMTLSGRVRGKCNFTETRNQAFQAAAADGAIICIWRLLREGFDVRLFVHDEAVVKIKDDHLRDENVQRIEQIMTKTMSDHLGGIRISVESCISRSWSTLDEVTTPAPSKPAVNSLLKGRVAGTKRKSKVDAVGSGGRKTFAEMVKANEFDDGTLPF